MIEKEQILDDLTVYRNFITRSEAEKTINLLNRIAETREDFWKPISFYESYSSGYPEDNDPILEEFGLPNDWFTQLYNRFRVATAENAKISESKLSKISFHTQRWLPGAFAPEHSDNSSDDGVLGAFTRSRYATFLYLNDDFEGGELVFPSHDITILPEAGMLATFHGGHSNKHRVDIVKKSTRYTIGSFFDDREESDYPQETRDAWAKELAEVRAAQKEQSLEWNDVREKGLRIDPYGRQYPAVEVE